MSGIERKTYQVDFRGRVYVVTFLDGQEPVVAYQRSENAKKGKGRWWVMPSGPKAAKIASAARAGGRLLDGSRVAPGFVRLRDVH